MQMTADKISVLLSNAEHPDIFLINICPLNIYKNMYNLYTVYHRRVNNIKSHYQDKPEQARNVV